MLLIFDGNSGIDAHVWSDLGYLIMYGIESTNLNDFFSERYIFCLRAQHVLNYHDYYTTMINLREHVQKIVNHATFPIQMNAITVYICGNF